MYQNILIPMDLSGTSQDVIDTALKLAASGASLTLTHVVERIVDDFDDEVEQFYQRLAKKAEDKLKEWNQYINQENADIQRIILVGKRAPEILQYADDSDVDLIIIGSHAPVGQHTDFEQMSFGTLSQQIAMFARCSVLIVR